ncbi:MAG: hypothetical protein GX241_06125 [Ruminococcaceae bacterium]|nr:hypothetical protein [Oscillospiraceae bacterium]
MNAKEKRLVKSLGLLALGLLAIAYVVYQIFMLAYTPIETEVALEYTVEDVLETETFIARNETYIINDKTGTIISVVDDGSRVAKGQEVAIIFTDDLAADNYLKIRDLEMQIERYTRLASQSDNYTFNINDLDGYIDNAVMEYVRAVDNERFAFLSDSIDNLRDQVVTRQIATGSHFDFQTKLKELKFEYEGLKDKNTKHATVKAGQSGYYISGTDGLEQIVDCSKVEELTVDDIYSVFKAKAEKTPDGAIGKMVTEFTWYFLCVVDANRIGNLEVGDFITVNLPFSAVNTIKAKVHAINENTGDEAAVILSCNLMNSDISSLRHETAELVIDSYKGIKIPVSAIRVNERDEKGVFIQKGNIIEFRKINIIYSAKDYILSKSDANEEGYVRLYDNVITEGKDLYDGKVIK